MAVMKDQLMETKTVAERVAMKVETKVRQTAGSLVAERVGLWDAYLAVSLADHWEQLKE